MRGAGSSRCSAASSSTSPGTEFDEPLEQLKADRGVELDTDLSAEDLRGLAARYREIVQEHTGEAFPSDPYRQLELAVRAVFDSWFGKRAHDYREFNKIPHDLGTAVNVVTMVFGNMGTDSGTGVAFTRDPNTGEKTLFGEYLTNAQGEDVVAGIRTPAKISQMRDEMPEVYAQFEAIAERLERHYRDAQDLEFTIERGTLYMLQTRSAKRTAPAAVKIAVDMANEELLSREEAIQQGRPSADRPAPPAALRRGGKGAGPGPIPGQGAQRVAGSRHRPRRLRSGSGGGHEGGRRPGDPGADRDEPRRRARHACRARRPDRTRWRDLPRRGRGALDGARPAWQAPSPLRIDYARTDACARARRWSTKAT